ncbi:serine/threonine-protein kinase [Nocardia testacea]|uniref:serine/threonine-protein kinase n=1 Tax=Nocardia testacea TaxID=248551 RepID=UPI00340A6680
MEIEAGMDFAGYRIERRLGSGGMGTVFLVRHPRLPRMDALKVLSPAHTGDAEFRSRFLREAEIAARLQHPNLVAVRDRGETDGVLWIAMQYVAGSDAAELVRRSPAGLDVERVVSIVEQAARGLDEIHRGGMLHRDVKPANILVATPPAGPERVLVTDFGIARRLHDGTSAAETQGFTATLAYAAPEQLNGDRTDHRADVYAFGCTLYQLLTGRVPFPRANPGAVMYAHLYEPPPRPSAVAPGVPPGFDTVVATAMAKNPADRYPSCGVLAAAAREAFLAAPPPATRKPAKWLLLGALGAVLVVIAAFALAAGTRDSAGSTDRSATAAAPTMSVNTAEWGTYSYIAEAFPALLPPSPPGVGYQELTLCMAMNPATSALLPIQALDTAVPLAMLFCTGNNDPARWLTVTCNADRTPIGPEPGRFQVQGNEQWTRPSGSGNLHWGIVPAERRLAHLEQGGGYLQVYFDDPARSFCRIEVIGPVPGTELRERWWADAPL